MDEYEKLFESWNLHGFEIKNRIGVPPLVVYSWCDETGMVTDKHIRHYMEYVHGGAGFVRQEATCVSEYGRLTLDQLGIWNDKQKPGLARIKDILKSTGMPAVIQLSHAGLIAKRLEDRVGPSDCSFELNGQCYSGRGLTVEEIKGVEKDFIDAAKRAYDIGYDGVELHACHGYLLSQFMNNRVNLRTDEYNAADKLLMANIIDGIRAVTSEEFLIGIRLGIFEPDLESGLRTAAWLESKGVAYIEAYYGCDWAMDIYVPEDFSCNPSIFAAKKVKEIVKIPVFTGFEITTGEEAEKALIETGADLAVIGRGHLVNPEWGNYVKNNLNPGHCHKCSWCMWKIDPEKCPGNRELKQKKICCDATQNRECPSCGGVTFNVKWDRSLDEHKIKSNSKDEIINMIIDEEWAMFDEVNNVGGRADCQDDGETFYRMRYSGHSCMSVETLNSYYEDIQTAKTENRNLITEKYAFMMEKTDNAYFNQSLKPFLPEISEEKHNLIAEIVKIKVDGEIAFVQQYPYFSRGSRPTEDNAYGMVSVKNYEDGELKTYSEKTLQFYLNDLRALVADGLNPSFVVHDKMARLYGYDGVQDAENKIRSRYEK